MKTVVIGESSGASMETIMAVYPRHKAIVDKYVARGVATPSLVVYRTPEDTSQEMFLLGE